jgi:hypothetical protein
MDEGVNFPAEHGRGSTRVGKQVLAAAVRALDPALAARIEAEPDWRHAYPQYFTDVTVLEAGSDTAALSVARAGLEAALGAMVFVRDGQDLPLATATADVEAAFGTQVVHGSGEHVAELAVPYRGKGLKGAALLRQLDDWVSRGITEPSFAEAVSVVARNPDWLDLSDRTFALVGAGSQMGPFMQLLAWGAHVAAIDIPRPQTWERLAGVARASAGRLSYPARASWPDTGPVAGADLLRDVGPLTRWLADLSGPMTLGNYAYADGALFVRLSVAFDLLVEGLRRRRDDLSLAYLATPSDAFIVPMSAVEASTRRYARLRTDQLQQVAAPGAPAGWELHPNFSDNNIVTGERGRFGIVSAFIVDQGPNYALAKRLQRWRMVVDRAAGVLTSVHVAPPTRTQSVHSNPEMEKRQQMTARLGLETFDADTAQALATAILVHDLRNPQAPANPAVSLVHPHQIFMFAANPGGRWRSPFDPSNALPVLGELARHGVEIDSLEEWLGGRATVPDG